MTTEQIMSGLRRARRSQSGVAAVEFVLCLPVIALMLFGTIDIGRLLFDYHAVSKSVRDAARYIARSDGAVLFSDLATCAVDPTTAAGSPTQNARNMALTGTVDLSGGYILTYWTDTTTVAVSGVCFDNSAGTYQGFYPMKPKRATAPAFDPDDIPIVRVAATVSFPLLNGWLLGQDNDLTFTISHEEAFIGE